MRTNRKTITAVLTEELGARVEDRAVFKNISKSREIVEGLRYYYSKLDELHTEWRQVLTEEEMNFLAKWLPTDVEISAAFIPALIENALWNGESYRAERGEFAHLLNRIRKSADLDKQALCDVIRAVRMNGGTK